MASTAAASVAMCIPEDRQLALKRREDLEAVKTTRMETEVRLLSHCHNAPVLQKWL